MFGRTRIKLISGGMLSAVRVLLSWSEIDTPFQFQKLQILQ
jgi:hypothetical protein